MNSPPADLAHASIVETARILPPREISNYEIGERLLEHTFRHADTAILERTRERAQLIEQKTGLRSRRFFDRDVSPVTVGVNLLEDLVPNATWSSLDAVIVSSSSVQGFPGLSQQIVAAARERHRDLRAPFVLDVGSNACTGFMYGLAIAISVIKGMEFKNVACLAIEFSSRCIAYDPLLFGTSTLFGDAAAGMLLSGASTGRAKVISFRASSDLNSETIEMIKGGGVAASDLLAEVPLSSRWSMSGPPVAIAAIRILVQEIQHYQDQGIAIDWLIPHQANLTRILLPACQKTNIPISRLRSSFSQTGNTSSASVPFLFDDLLKSGDAKKGDKVLLISFGASFTVASALIEVGES